MKRSFVIPFLIASIAAVAVIVQTTRVTPLIDYTYQVEAAYRIYGGQMPYRDFFLVVPPGTYMVLAALMVLSGGYSHIVTVIFTAILAGINVLLLNEILSKLKIPFLIRMLLLSILPFTGHGIYPWPNYDVYSGIAINALFYWLICTAANNRIAPRFGFFFGAAGATLILFKQNTGVAYCLGIIAVFFLTAVRFRKRQSFILLLSTVAGMAVFLLLSLGYIVFNKLGPAIVEQTINFAGSARQPMAAVAIVKGQYIMYFLTVIRQLPFLLIFLIPLLIMKKRTGWLPLVLNAGLFLFLAVLSIHGIVVIPSIKDQYNMILLFSWVTVYSVYIIVLPFLWIRSKNLTTFLPRIFPIAFLITAHATYLTHHIVGSSYGLWPIFVIMTGINIAVIQEAFPNIYCTPLIGLFCCFLFYILFMNYQSKQFFDYVSLDGKVGQSTTPRLAGAGTPGPWMNKLDQLLTYVAVHIPANDAVVTVPGEDPFYAATGRKNPLPILMFHRDINPLSSMDFPKYFAQKGVVWVIAKTETQLNPVFGFIDLTRPEYGLSRYYATDAQVGIYTIYKRNSSPI